MLHWLLQLLDPQGLQQIIASGGLAVLTAIIFAETGLLVGFFLPGDSLLFLAGTMTAVNLLDPSRPPPARALRHRLRAGGRGGGRQLAQLPARTHGREPRLVAAGRPLRHPRAARAGARLL